MRRVGLVLAVAAVVACARASTAPDADHGVEDELPIDGNSCLVQPCSILPQCGCPAQSACDVDSATPGTKCRAISAPGREATACDTLDDCDQDYICFGATQSRACKKYCRADTDCESPRGRCVFDVTSNGTPIAGVPSVCSSNCDPVSTNPPECPSTFKCGIYVHAHFGTDVRIANCMLAGGGIQGSNCKSGSTGDDTLCGKTTICTTTDAGSTYKCRKICTNPGNSSSAQCAGQACIAFAATTPSTLAGVTYGVCAP